MTYNVTQTGGQTVLISGTVTDQNPSSVDISFTGVVNTSITASANGTFSVSTTASALGEIDGVDKGGPAVEFAATPGCAALHPGLYSPGQE